MSINERIEALRNAMDRRGIDAYVIPTSDPHQSEYVAEHWKAREWISGFTGSAGTAVVTKTHAGLWTDSRYYLQAEEQLAGSEFELHKLKSQGFPEYISWLTEHLGPETVVGFDGTVMPLGTVRKMIRSFDDAEIELFYKTDLIDEIWDDRPEIPLSKVHLYEERYAGRSCEGKIEELRDQMESEQVDACLVTALDDIAWLLNIRGSDVQCNPVTISYVWVSGEEIHWFIDQRKLLPEVDAFLERNGIQRHDYLDLEDFLEEVEGQTTVRIDPSSLNIKLHDCMDHLDLKEEASAVMHMKSVKNEVEQNWIRKVMIQDGVALVRFYRWLERAVEEEELTEYDLVERLDDFRGANDDYRGESFNAIVGFKGNGAIVHYRAKPDESAKIEGEGMLLIDSGGQYLKGTTDITRTTYIGQPDDIHRRHYTLVLKGHIALARAIFPKGTKGVQLDSLARHPLWKKGLNYGHGTGHGVGFYLNVHEPPQGFTSGLGQRGETPFKPGMLTSNEPGIYLEDQYGIRIENLVLSQTVKETEFGNYLGFETVTLFPLHLPLIERSLLTDREIAWINSYHQQVIDALSPELNAEESTWLKKQCAPL